MHKLSNIFNLFSNLDNKIAHRQSKLENRILNIVNKPIIKTASNQIEEIPPLLKLAFDTRRTNQLTEINPRRNLQYFHRSQDFVDPDMAHQIKIFAKIKTATDIIKNECLGSPEWFDSNTRLLNASVDRALRVNIDDGDFSHSHFNYLNNLLFVRYRLTAEEITHLSIKNLIELILIKDEKLMYKNSNSFSIYTEKEAMIEKKTEKQENCIILKLSVEKPNE